MGYTHVPQHIRSDAGKDGIRGRWDEREKEAIADRVEAGIERLAPGFRATVRARRVLAPPDLERLNPALVGGAVNQGTTNLHQQLVFRPVPGTGRPRTPIRGSTSPPPRRIRAAASTGPRRQRGTRRPQGPALPGGAAEAPHEEGPPLPAPPHTSPHASREKDREDFRRWCRDPVLRSVLG